MYETKVLADSTAKGKRLTTLQVTIPRMVLAEFNTHRDFSRNSASSRAIPVLKNVDKIIGDPFIPEAFAKNQKGMQEGEDLTEEANERARTAWLVLRDASVLAAMTLNGLEVHKHWGNRPLELFGGQTIIVTATRWANFYALRNHPMASPEMRYSAQSMLAAMEASTPIERVVGQWHLPFISDEEKEVVLADLDASVSWLVKLSIARCARVSYLTHDGKYDVEADLALYERLTSSGHMSPLEHAAKVANDEEIKKYAYWRWSDHGDESIGGFVPVCIGNFDVPWLQHRKMIPGEDVFHG